MNYFTELPDEIINKIYGSNFRKESIRNYNLLNNIKLLIQTHLTHMELLMENTESF